VIKRAFDEFFTPRRTMREAAAGMIVWEPAVEMYETDGEVVVRAELPNIDPKQLDITVTSDTVTLKGQTKGEEEQKDRNYYWCEIRYGEFTRTLSLATEVKSAEAKASYKDGILEIKIPKSEWVKPTSVKVQVG